MFHSSEALYNTRVYVQRKQDSYNAMDHAESKDEVCSKERIGKYSLTACCLKADKHAYWKAKAAAYEQTLQQT